MAAPTVAEVAAALDATVVTGGEAALDRDVLGYVVGGAHVPAVLKYLADGALLITPGDRADVIVAAHAAHAAGHRHPGRPGADHRRVARTRGRCR